MRKQTSKTLWFLAGLVICTILAYNFFGTETSIVTFQQTGEINGKQEPSSHQCSFWSDLGVAVYSLDWPKLLPSIFQIPELQTLIMP